MTRPMHVIIHQAREIIGSDLPEKPEDVLACLLIHARSFERQANEADEAEDVDAHYVDEKVAYPFRLAALARGLAIELILGYHLLPSNGW